MLSAAGTTATAVSAAGSQLPAVAVQGLLHWISFCGRCSSSQLPLAALHTAEKQPNALGSRQYSSKSSRNPTVRGPASSLVASKACPVFPPTSKLWERENLHLGGWHSSICTRSLAQAAAALATKPPSEAGVPESTSSADWSKPASGLEDFIAADDSRSPTTSFSKSEYHVREAAPRRGRPAALSQDETGPLESQQHMHQHHHAQAPGPHHRRHQPHLHTPPQTSEAPQDSDANELLSANEYRSQHNMRVEGMDPPDPVQSFSGVHFHPKIWSVLRDAGFPAPTPIQAQAWPIAMSGRDLVGLASTGSGKTVAFLLPAFEHIMKQQRERQAQKPRSTGLMRAGGGPTAIVLAPTRELAQQIYEEARRFGRGVKISSAVVYGGASKSNQIMQLDRFPQLVVATPGRLLDFIETGDVDVRQVSYLVLDEADRMLDMGFEPQINQIVQQLPASRQTLFFSATWPQEVQQIARRYVNQDPVTVFMGDVTSKPVASKSVTQIVRVVNKYDKPAELGNYLQQLGPTARVMVFCNTKRKCDSLELQINQAGLGLRAAALHGDKTQMARDRILNGFRSGRLHVLVATDVAARGLDVSGVTAVVNYDYPQETEMYVHRIGRTGRGGATGESFTLFTQEDRGFAEELLEVLEGAEQEVPGDLQSMAEAERAKRSPPPRKRYGGDRSRHADKWRRGWEKDRRDYGDRSRGGNREARAERWDSDWSNSDRDRQQERGRRWDGGRESSRGGSSHHHADRFKSRRGSESAKEEEFDY